MEPDWLDTTVRTLASLPPQEYPPDSSSDSEDSEVALEMKIVEENNRLMALLQTNGEYNE